MSDSDGDGENSDMNMSAEQMMQSVWKNVSDGKVKRKKSKSKKSNYSNIVMKEKKKVAVKGFGAAKK